MVMDAKQAIRGGFLALVLASCLPATGFGQTPSLHLASMAALPPETPVEAIVIKFRDDVRARLTAAGKLTQKADGAKVGVSAGIQSDFSSIEGKIASRGLKMRRHFDLENEDSLDQWIARARQRSQKALADLNSFYSIPLPANTKYADVADLIAQLASNKSIEAAYASPVPRNAQGVQTPNIEPQQGYLDAAPNGIDARYAWTLPGGRGDGVPIIDVEYAWNTSHEDFPALYWNSGAYNYTFGDDHGTAVIGILAAKNNGYGATGIVSNAMIGVRSVNSTISMAQAVLWAVQRVGVGGIVLIEQQRQGPVNSGTDCGCSADQCHLVPVEYDLATFQTIQSATATGAIVVEAAGNGGGNLDSAVYGGLFDRNQRDSGAIIVGAGYSFSRQAECFSNYGNRVDVHGWGDLVATLGYGDRWPFNSDPATRNYQYTQHFGGTSSASPIVAGAVASLQGIRLAAGQEPLSSQQMRSVLVASGTPLIPGAARAIGPLPNLRAAISQSGSGPPPPDVSWLLPIISYLLQ